jgi:proline iminopeptidase
MKKLILLFAFITTIQISQAQELYCKTFGNTKDIPVLFLHGGPGYNCASFEVSTAQKLSENGFYVIVYDRRGEGRSTDLNAKYNFQETFDDINNILKKYQIKKINLIGHSFGGVVATLFSEKYPQIVNATILVSAPVSLQETFRTILATCRKIYTEKQDQTNLNYIDMVEKMDTTSSEYFSYSFGHAMQNGFYFPKKMSDEAKLIYTNCSKEEAFKNAKLMTNEPPEGFLKNEKYTSINLTENLKKLVSKKAKIFALFGKDDGLYSQKQVKDVSNILGNHNVNYFENCSHSVFIDQQQLFITSLKTFLK